MIPLLQIVIIAALVGIFKPYIKGWKRWHFALLLLGCLVTITLIVRGQAGSNPSDTPSGIRSAPSGIRSAPSGIRSAPSGIRSVSSFADQRPENHAALVELAEPQMIAPNYT